jgi:hypothetical protein
VTRPTQPAPKMPKGGFSAVTRAIYLWSGLRPLAIASIVSFDIESRSVFTTQ